MTLVHLVEALCLAVCATASVPPAEAACAAVGKAHEYYTVQVLATPVENEQALLHTCQALRDAGELVYYGPTRVDDRRYLHLRVGLFDNRTQAQEYAERLTEGKGFGPFVAGARVFVDCFRDQFQVVTTPSGIWCRTPGRARELYPFRPIFAEAPDCPARISPTGTHIVFYHDGKILTMDLSTGKANIVREGTRPDELLHSVVRWSPDGRYLGFLDAVAWELPTRLWIMRPDGTESRCLACDESGQSKVKSFRWHPRRDRIFYVVGPTHGTVSVGGTLRCVDLQGNRRTIAPEDASGLTEVASDFYLAEGTLHYRIAWFDENGRVRRYTPHTYDIGNRD